jgi:hypothetical protein
VLDMLPLPAGWRDTLAWLVAPSVTPWAGALAAVIAAFVVSPVSWIKHFGLAIPRAVLAVAAWLAALWAINIVATEGWTGLTARLGFPAAAAGNNGAATAPAVPAGGPPAAVPPPARAAAVHFDVRFVTEPADPTRVMDFSCDVTIDTHKGPPATLRVQGTDWPSFEKELALTLRSGAGPGTPAAVRIRRTPDPGPNTLERTRRAARATLPVAEVRVGD